MTESVHNYPWKTWNDTLNHFVQNFVLKQPENHRQLVDILNRVSFTGFCEKLRPEELEMVVEFAFYLHNNRPQRPSAAIFEKALKHTSLPDGLCNTKILKKKHRNVFEHFLIIFIALFADSPDFNYDKNSFMRRFAEGFRWEHCLGKRPQTTKDEELLTLMKWDKAMDILTSIIPPTTSYTLAMTLIPKVVEGWNAKYTTGGVKAGKRPAPKTANRDLVVRSGCKVEKRSRNRCKNGRSDSEDSQQSGSSSPHPSLSDLDIKICSSPVSTVGKYFKIESNSLQFGFADCNLHGGNAPGSIRKSYSEPVGDDFDFDLGNEGFDTLRLTSNLSDWENALDIPAFSCDEEP